MTAAQYNKAIGQWEVKRVAGQDIAEKILESYDDVFADIVNGLLFGGETVIRPEELEDQAPRAAYKADGQLREIERDVAKRWTRSSIRIACIGFENQTEPDAAMPLRVYGYDGAEYRAQLLKENRGSPLYPVVTLVLYFGHKKHWDKPLTLHEAVHVPELFKPYVPDVRINLFEIAFLSREQVSRFKSDFRVVADYFVQMRENGDYVPSRETLDHVQATVQLLSIMTRDRRYEEAYNDSPNKQEVRNMCDVLDRVEQRGRAQGRAEGIAEGRAKGKAEGRDEGRAEGLAQGAEEQAKMTAMNLHRMGLSPADIAQAVNRSSSLVRQWLGVGMA